MSAAADQVWYDDAPVRRLDQDRGRARRQGRDEDPFYDTSSEDLLRRRLSRWNRHPLADANPWSARDLVVCGGLAALGLLGLLVTWFGVSGQSTYQAQRPWFVGAAASTAVAALGGVTWLSAGLREVHRHQALAGYRLSDDLGLPTVSTDADTRGEEEPGVPTRRGGLVTAAGMTRTHTPACPLAAGKELQVLTSGEAADRGLTACGVCQP